MSVLSKVATAGQRRGMWQLAGRLAAWAAIGFVAFKLPGILPPGYGLLLITAIACAVIFNLTKFNPAETAGPTKGKTQLVTAVVAGGSLYVVFMARAALARGVDPVSRPILVVLAVAAVAVIAATAWSRLRDTHPTALPVTIGDAVDAVTDGGRIRAALVAAIVVGAAGSLAYAGVTVAPVVAILAFLIPVKLGWRAARTRGNTRAEFSAAFVGLLSGGAWTRPLEDAARSPIACRWDDDRTAPTRIVMPLPAKWASTGVEALEGEVSARLAEHGLYVVRVELGATRRVTATLVPPMPTTVRYDGRPAEMGTRVWLGVGQAGRSHAVAPGSRGKANGDLLDVYWDLRTEPMGLAVGTIGSGKTQTISLIMMQLALAGFRLILLDPKRVEFAAWEGRPGILKVATELGDMVSSLTAARSEMQTRFEEMRAGGVNHIDLLPPESRPPRLLIVVDEVVELLDKVPGKSDEAKEANDLKDQASAAIGSILQLGRAAGVHLLVAGQRVERSLFSGTWQNNIALKILHGTADTIERQMIGLTDVVAASGIPGRAVMRSLALPQTEVQVAYVDLQKDLDRYLPVGGVEVAPPAVDLQPEDLVPLQPVSVVPMPTPPVKPVGPTPVTDRDKVAGPEVTDPTVTFADVGGYDDVKAQLMDAVGTLINNPGAAAKYRITPSGVLLYGPPGTGKTLLAEATAGEFGLQFCKVTTGNLTSKWVSAGPERVIAMADAVIAAAPCLLFIDEFDGIAPRRGGDTHHEDDKVLLELLRQMDRLRLVPGVVVMAATNRFEALDPAAIRDGRMGTKIRVDLPDGDAREAILHAALARRPLAPDIDVASIVEATDGATGATLAGIVTVAATVALKADRLITTQDLLDAIKSRGGKDRPTVESAGLDRLILDPQSRATINQLLSLLTNPAQAKALGFKPPTGAILYGPPGTGKTSLARAIAAEAGYSFYPCKGSDFMSAYAGRGDRAVEELFERARANKPSIIFIDEIDGLATNRDDMPPWHAATVTTLLTLLDGFASNVGVFTIAATNRFEALDPGLVRGGRLSEHIEIGLPDKAGREALLALFTSTMPVAEDVDLAAFAHMLEGFSPSDIEGVVQKAAMAALNHANTAGVPAGTVTAADFATALGILPGEVTRTAPAPDVNPGTDADADADAFTDVVDAEIVDAEIVDDEDGEDIVDDAWIPDDLVERLTRQ